MPNDVQNVDVTDTKKSSISSPALSNEPISIDSPISDTIVQLDGVINTVAGISSSQVNCSIDINTGSEETTQCFDEASACNLGATNVAHLPIRKRTQEAYLSNANKRIKTRNQYIAEL
ncbi:unnamed protein product [Didymodactylos carnosus]|uniref:Uncharacterized protein n=1 Tax=Didymodactylos carnosus TaxID=1234261 RepID=A0A814I7R8_9BILA|nr:unnamed protein product [Didymodactylos carnosus]CAF1187017.1 unnamed protein product [Didymodactylos carnosus]CAF3789632.1 unnamed protein product [Didymodactylos carnosus]CAF3998053.1 unnamed protein product [Didymodactylos carnosus]